MNTIVTGATPADRREYVAALRKSGLTLQEIGEGLGVSRERVRQLCIGRTERMWVSSRPVDPIRLVQAARHATSLHGAARVAGCNDYAAKEALTALGLMPALVRLWNWRRTQRKASRQQSLVARIKHAAGLLGRTPTAAEMNAHLHNLPDVTSCISAFGAHDAAIIAAGLTPRRRAGPDKWVRERKARRLRTHCKRGHEFTPENTKVYRWRGKDMRYCRACSRLRSNQAYAQRKQRNATNKA